MIRSTRSVWTRTLPAVLPLAAILLLAAGPHRTTPPQDRMGELVRSNMVRRGAPGAAVAVVQDGRIVYEAGFGVQSVATGTAVSPESLFRLGSTTKLVTAATLVRLAVEKGISLESQIGEYTPGLDAALSGLTAHQILSHTAGILDEAPMQGPDDPAALGEGIRSWTSDELFTEPGDIFSYSNPGYWLAGYLAETLSGSYFNETVKEEVLRPLGIRTATFDPREVDPALLADAHDSGRRDEPVLFKERFNHAGTWPSGSLYISAHDYGRLLIALMDDGMLDDSRVLPPQVPEQMLRPQASIPFPDGYAYGYGVFRESWGGTEVFTHTGTRRGYGSIFIMVPSQRFAVVVLCNLDTTVLSDAAKGIVEAYTGLSRPQESAGPRERFTSEASFEPYLGTYRNSDSIEIELYTFKPIRIAREGGQFFFKMRMMKLPVWKTGALRFSTDYVDFVLIPDERGEIRYLFGEFHALRRLQARR